MGALSPLKLQRDTKERREKELRRFSQSKWGRVGIEDREKKRTHFPFFFFPPPKKRTALKFFVFFFYYYVDFLNQEEEEEANRSRRHLDKREG